MATSPNAQPIPGPIPAGIKVDQEANGWTAVQQLNSQPDISGNVARELRRLNGSHDAVAAYGPLRRVRILLGVAEDEDCSLNDFAIWDQAESQGYVAIWQLDDGRVARLYGLSGDRDAYTGRPQRLNADCEGVPPLHVLLTMPPSEVLGRLAIVTRSEFAKMREDEAETVAKSPEAQQERDQLRALLQLFNRNQISAKQLAITMGIVYSGEDDALREAYSRLMPGTSPIVSDVGAAVQLQAAGTPIPVPPLPPWRCSHAEALATKRPRRLLG